MSEERAIAPGFKPLADIRSYAYAAIDPGEPLLQATAFAAPPPPPRASLSLTDIDVPGAPEAVRANVLLASAGV